MRGLDGALDVDLGITPVTHALTVQRLGLEIGQSADVQVAGLDVVGAEIRIDARRFTRIAEDRYRTDDLESGGCNELRSQLPAWSIEVSSVRNESVTS